MSCWRVIRIAVVVGLAAFNSVSVDAQTIWGSGRRGHALANDGELLLVGGERGRNTLLGDVWRRDRARGWARQPTPFGLAPRTEHATASLRNEAFLFGGRRPDGRPTNDTWIRTAPIGQTSNSWMHMSAAATDPVPRSQHAMAYHRVLRQVVMFGGLDGGLPTNRPLGDTWIWAESSQLWCRVAVSGPSARYDHAMAFDEASGKVVLFGGVDSTGRLGDTWTWDGVGWTQESPATGPSARGGHAMSLAFTPRQIVLFGGLTAGNAYSNETWMWDGRDWSFVQIATPPPGRAGHAMERDPTTRDRLPCSTSPCFGAGRRCDDRLVIFGGEGAAGLLSDWWELDGTTWCQRDPAPPPREAGAIAYDTVRDEIVLFGGEDSVQLFDDTWVWNGLVWIKKFTPAPPPARAAHAMVYDEKWNQVVLFAGGGSGLRQLSDTWAWDGSAWSQLAPSGSGPRARGKHRLVYDSARKHILLYGGETNGTTAEDTWSWDGTSWRQHMPTARPQARRNFGMVYDQKRGKTVVFGGDHTGGWTYVDTWEWDGTNWNQQFPAAWPPARTEFAMVYDAARARTVLFGGKVWRGNPSNKTWEWDGSNWQSVMPRVSPGPTRSNMGVYHRGLGSTVVFGGFVGVQAAVLRSDLWFHRAEVAATYTTFGTGCTPAVLQLDRAPVAGNLPWLGTTLNLVVTGLAVGRPAVLLIGGSTVSCGTFSVPLDLTPFGGTGCALLTCPDILVPAAASMSLPIPPGSVLLGRTFHNQVVAAGVSNMLVTSNRADASIGAK